MSLPEGSPSAPLVATHASAVAGALLLLVSLMLCVLHVGHLNARCLNRVQGCLNPGHCHHGGRVKTGITGTSAMTGVGFTGATAAAGWQSHKGPYGCRNQDHRPCCCCCLPVAMDATAVGRLGSCSLPPLMLLGSLGCPLSCYSGGGGGGLGAPGSWAPPLLLSWTHFLCVSQSPHLYMHKCLGISSILGCWVKAPLLGYWHFFGCRLAGRDKECILFCHDADVTVQNSEFLCCPAYHSFLS